VRLAKTTSGLVAWSSAEHRALPGEAGIDELLIADDPSRLLQAWFDQGTPAPSAAMESLLAPIESQEVWAAGVTYSRSRTARVEESHEVGADRFYDLVYEADRPELFFKATPNRVVGPGAGVRIRVDSSWNVPEPELTMVISARGQVIGYTIGNDMSSRSIEGENPLYLPQAKVYAQCAALGPWLWITPHAPHGDTAISLTISRDGSRVFEGATSIGEIVRPLDELLEYLFRDNEFPSGVFLMTGTGIVPGDDFTLMGGDEIAITIDGIGTLNNHVIAPG
jgi:2-dehydro-3-deoxy-D-arabinonate dehydratase